jgi:hypothetical protein
LLLALLAYWIAFLAPVLFRSIETLHVRRRMVWLAGAVCVFVFISTLLYFGRPTCPAQGCPAPDLQIHFPDER